MQFVDTIKFADHQTLSWGDYPGLPNLNMWIFETRRRRSKPEHQRGGTPKKTQHTIAGLGDGQVPRTKECWQSFEDGKEKKVNGLIEPPEGMQPYNTLIVAQSDP